MIKHHYVCLIQNFAIALFIFIALTFIQAIDTHAEEPKKVSGEIKITGILPSVEANVLVYVSIGINKKDLITTKNNTTLNAHRDRNGHYAVKFPELLMHKGATHYAIYGRLIDMNHSSIGFLPVTVGPVTDFKRGQRLITTISALLNLKSAFIKSYPFSKGIRQGFVKEKNINLILFSLRQMIEQNIVQNEDEWKDVFLLFKQNSYFFSRASPDYLTRILEFLTTYSRIINTKQSMKIGFHEFYVTYLNDITNLDVDGIQVFGDRLDAYIFQQLKEQFANYLDELLYVSDDTLRTYHNNREYKKCVQLSTVMFQNIASQEAIIKDIKENESIRESIYHTMIAATLCGQSCYVANNMGSNPFGGDIKSAKKYLMQQQNGKDYINSFIKLFEALEDEGLMPRRGRNQVKELAKYYNVYTTSNE